MQPRNILIHIVVAIAALHAAAIATPASAVMPVPEYAVPVSGAGACKAPGDESAASPAPYVAYPEGDVVFLAPAGAGNE